MNDSVIARTGQVWKLALAIGLLLVGSIAPAFEASGMSWTVGSILAIGGYAFGLLTLRCPECGNRWFWSAAMDPGWYGPLFKKPACPACKRQFDGR